jgi:hypothetical protein
MPERVSRPYWEWEDHRAGLYRTLTAPGEDVRAAELLTDPVRLLDAMRQAVQTWPMAAEHHLSNPEENRRAWLGWAACMVAVGACARATRYAWPRLTEDERVTANAAADRVVAEWEGANSLTLFDTGEG